MESLGIDIMSCDVDMVCPVKQSTMQVSKAFRSQLPGLRDDEASNLRRWAELHCAQSAVFRNPDGSVVLVGLKDEFRTSASFMRTSTGERPSHSIFSVAPRSVSITRST